MTVTKISLYVTKNNKIYHLYIIKSFIIIFLHSDSDQIKHKSESCLYYVKYSFVLLQGPWVVVGHRNSGGNIPSAGVIVDHCVPWPVVIH